MTPSKLSILIFLISLFSCQSSPQNDTTTEEPQAQQEQTNSTTSTIPSSPAHEETTAAIPASALKIIGYDIWVRDAPKTGEVVRKLEHGRECEILEKGEADEINGLSDYWYLIRMYNGKTGYVFGSQTTARANTPNDADIGVFPLPEALAWESYASEEILKKKAVLDKPIAYFLGWGQDGHFAYAQMHQAPTSFMELDIVVKNASNEVIREQKFSPIDDHRHSYEGVKTIWKDNFYAIHRYLERYQIQPINGALPWHNFKSRAQTQNGKEHYYAVHFDNKTEQAADWGNVIVITEENMTVEADGHFGKKLIQNTYEPIYCVKFIEAPGYLRRPNSDQAVIVRIIQQRGFEGQRIILDFFAWNLTDLD